MSKPTFQRISGVFLFLSLIVGGSFALTSNAQAQTIVTGWLCNKSDESIQAVTASPSITQEMVNGVLTTVVSYSIYGWINLAPGACTGASASAIPFVEPLVYAQSASGTRWPAGTTTRPYACADNSRGIFFRSVSVYAAGGAWQYLRHNCNQEEFRYSENLNLTTNGQGATVLLPGGQISYRN